MGAHTRGRLGRNVRKDEALVRAIKKAGGQRNRGNKPAPKPLNLLPTGWGKVTP